MLFRSLASTEARLNKLEAAVAWKRKLEMGTILVFGTLNVVVKLLG